MFRALLPSLLLTSLVVPVVGAQESAGTQPTSGGEVLGDSDVHPRLLLRPRDLFRLRARAQQSPWRELADSALEFAATETFDPNDSLFDAKNQMTDLCGALALAFVLEPGPEKVQKLKETLDQWPAFYLQTAPPGEGLSVRWRQAAMIQTIFALDVMHDELSSAELVQYATMLDGMILGWWENLEGDGTTSTPGVVAIWALYANRMELAHKATDLYLERLRSNLTPSGVYDSGPGYAWSRQGSDRIGKYALLDVLERTGFDRAIYSDERLAGLQEWMYGGSFTPRLTNLTFGDSDPSRIIEGRQGYSAPYRAARFSHRAGRNAAWTLDGVEPRPLLSTYVLMYAGGEPTPPRSSLWGDAASFWEADAGVDSLMGALWSPRGSGSHSHKDVNAVHLYAYGENILRNSGYCGSGVGVNEVFDWDWIHDQAASSNTLTLQNAEHEGSVGGGVIEGLLAGSLDYAAALAGPVLPDASHLRRLFMVHGEPGYPGYFVLLDEVQTAEPGTSIQVNLHPDSAQGFEVEPRLEYEWTVQRSGPNPVSVSLFLATRPDSAELRDGGLCAFDGKEFVGRYLRSEYVSDASARRRVLTLVIPHDGARPKPNLTRLQIPGVASGALMGFGGGFDIALASLSPLPIDLAGGSFDGDFLLARRESDGFRHYFALGATVVDDGFGVRTGLESQVPVSVFLRGLEARVAGPGGRATFFDRDLTGQSFTRPGRRVLAAGPGFVELELAPGSHAFRLDTGEDLVTMPGVGQFAPRPPVPPGR